MISAEMASRFNLPPIRKYPHPTRDWYTTFLIQTDYIVSKAAEAQLMGESVDDYTDVLRARKIARSAINAIDDGKYDGEEAMQEVDAFEPEEGESANFEYRDGKLVQVEGDPVDASAIPAEVASLISGLS